MPFRKAGLNYRHRTVAYALVAARQHGIHPAELIQFIPGGDLAWYSKRGSFLIWAEEGATCRLIGEAQRGAYHAYWHDRPCSDWPRRKNHLRAVA